MKVLFTILTLMALIVGAITAFAVTTEQQIASDRWSAHDLEPASKQGDPSNGEYIANIAGCVVCHTNTAINGALLAGGVMIKTPFGDFISPNISTSKQAGIGDWSDEQFAKAILLGLNEAGKHYYPTFPYNAYTNLSAQDIADVFAWIKTVAPSDGKNKPHQLSIIMQYRALIAFWKALYFKPKASDALADRGAYLVNGPTHCAECHSPRNALGGITSTAMSGNSRGPDGEPVPGISATDLEQWVLEDIDLFLEVGITPSGDSTGGHMADVIEYNTSFLTAEDRLAIARYLKSEKNLK